ncbi:MAG: bifunctional glutamate N-acetyltransferase/amino-acid acetyltransferase ArgJ [Gammaproteobacteria bacterium]
MAVLLKAVERLDAVAGIRIGTASLGLRSEPRDDLTVFEIAQGARAAAVFTRNALRAAPVVVAAEHLAQASPRALVINAGNANAGTGETGLAAARACCQALAGAAGIESTQVLPFSTGVINEPLDVAAMERALPVAVERSSADGWLAGARSIMTTDTVAKGHSGRFEAGGSSYRLTGIAKGSGMICPDMATMLAFLATDAPVEQTALDSALTSAVDVSFNAITVDGDTSTNDACLLVATGAAGGDAIGSASAGYASFYEALLEVCHRLAHAIVRDGEGATKFVTINVGGARDRDEARAVAYTVAHSPLVKTALFASDPNVGRISAAIGRAPIEGLDMSGVRVSIGDVLIAEQGMRARTYVEADGAAAMAEPEIDIDIDLGRGAASATVWTCDFSYDYVKINAEYRS